MFNKDHGYIVALVGLIVVFSWLATDGFRKTTVIDVGSMSIPFTSVIDVDTALTATTTITDANYDSFDLPLGTSFVGDPIRNFIVGRFSVNSSTADIRVDYGFGDTHVENSVSSPTNVVVSGSFVIPNGAGLERIPVIFTLPPGKHPFVRITGAASNGHIMIIGKFE